VFSALLKNDPGTSCLATGDIDEQGSVGPVGSLEQKLALAADRGFRLFLCPAQNGIPDRCGRSEVLPVRSLAEARMFAVLHAPGNAARLVHLSESLADPRSFIRDVRNLPARYLAWARDEGRLGPLLAGVVSEPEKFRELAAVLRRLIAAGEVETVALLAGSISAQRLEQLAAEVPLAVFNWCAAALWAANRLGKVAAAGAWEGLALKIQGRSGPVDTETAARFACMLVLSRHNRFIFTPRLPARV
jgi:hypothetical protein